MPAVVLGLLPALACAGDLNAVVRDASGREVADAVVVATPETPVPAPAAPRTETIVIDQVNKEFVPYVLPVRVGTSVNFPNRDNIRHHVYSFSRAKRFELPLYIGDPAAPVLFDQPGIVVLGCNIHDWMIAYLYVTPSPYFAKTGEDGRAVFKDIPEGRYTLRAWHPRLAGTEEATERPVAVPRSGSIESAWVLSLKPDFRIPRAPIPGLGGY